LVKEEQLDADKLKKVIDHFVYHDDKVLIDSDIVNLVNRPLGILERSPTRKRLASRIVDFVKTFIRGIAV